MSTEPYDGPLGVAIFDGESGLCVGVLSSDGKAETDIGVQLLLEPMPLDDLGEVFETHNPARQIARRGPAIGHLGDEAIPEYIQMSNGQRFVYAGTCAQPIDMGKLHFGCLVLLPGLIYEAPQQAGERVAFPVWSGTPLYKRRVDQCHPEDDFQVHPD